MPIGSGGMYAMCLNDDCALDRLYSGSSAAVFAFLHRPFGCRDAFCNTLPMVICVYMANKFWPCAPLCNEARDLAGCGRLCTVRRHTSGSLSLNATMPRTPRWHGLRRCEDATGLPTRWARMPAVHYAAAYSVARRLNGEAILTFNRTVCLHVGCVIQYDNKRMWFIRSW